ncbi:sigma-70 family RNA polymerase sigma factor [Rossellomorea vietnamensis]|uniref:sigma-70 family RNA polymerase sigma factor n=1 Tax=Rossellomorea vietnamensis TaxID=218284 RepID=UPI003D2B8D9A
MKSRANVDSVYNYLSSFDKNKPIFLASIKTEIINLFHKEVSIGLLEAYFLEKGYKDIQLKEPERKRSFIKETKAIVIPDETERELKIKHVEVDDDDEDFDPNAFIKLNKEKIEQTAIESSNFKENTWIIEKYQKESKVEILNELLINNRGLVESIANKYMKYRNNKLDYDDLVAEGYLGLMKAVDRFDSSRGYQFSTYATWWIRQSITRAIIDKGYTIRVPVHMHESISKVLKLEKQSILTFNEINVPWVSEQAEITEEKYHEFKKVDYMFLHLASLDTVVSQEDNETSLLDLIEYKPLAGLGTHSEIFFNPDELAFKEELRSLIEECLKELTEREREVLKHRIGWYDNRIKTLEEIGRIYGVTRERIRQIETKAIRKMRHASRSSKLKLYLDLF